MVKYTLTREQMESLFNAGIDFGINKIRWPWKTQDESINEWIEKKIDQNVSGELNGTFEVKSWKEMVGCCDRYDEKYKEIHFPPDAFTRNMESDMPKDRIIKVEDGYWSNENTDWHITREMIKREVK